MTQTTTSTNQCCKIPGYVRTSWKQEAKQINRIMYKIKKLCFNSDVRQSKHCNNNKLWREQPSISLVVEYTRDEVQIIQFSFLSKFNNFLKWQCKAVRTGLLSLTVHENGVHCSSFRLQLLLRCNVLNWINYGRCQAYATIHC